MAGCATKIGRLHIANAAVRKLAGDNDIKKGSYGDEAKQLAKLRVARIDRFKMRRHLASFTHPAPAKIYAKRNEKKTADKNSRQQKVNNNAHVRMHAAAAQRNGQKNQPGNRRCGDHNNTCQTDQVVREENNG